ncbi:MAG: NAD(P)H-hydrate dehydratase [Bacteroidia bacterium]|nr:NAD(P)H-hydrate dehydratase [Bacteroidia bacterium]
MEPILNPQQIREVDNLTCKNQNISSLQLMERAVRSIFDWLVSQFPDIAERRVVVLAGTGGNGGDAIGVANALSMVYNNVLLYQWTDGHRCSADNISMQERANRQSLSICRDTLPPLPSSSKDILLDGILGFGAHGGINTSLAERINAYPNIVSIDLPSGLQADGSFSQNSVVRAHHTLAIQLPKLAFFLPECDICIGQLHYLNIGLDTSCLSSLGNTEYSVMSDMQIDAPRPRACYKGNFGHVLSITGSDGMMGASVLSVRAALRSGAGLVTAVVPQKWTSILQISVPEAMVHYRKNINSLLQEPRKPYTIVIGSGLANDECSLQILMDTLIYAQPYYFPVIVDASSIHDLALLVAERKSLVNNLILTPHVGEFDALVGPSSSHLERIAKAKAFAKTYNSTIVLKNFRTAVITADEVIFCPYGNPGMATAGSGDVLAGVLAGYIAAHDTTSLTTICQAVALHSLAADKAATHISERALTASDIIAALSSSY